MSHVKRMEKEDKCDKLLRQFPNGIRISILAQKLEVTRSTVYDYLNSLELKGKAHYEKGIAYPKKPSIEEKPVSEFFINQFWRNLDNVRHLCASGDLTKAFYGLRSLAKTWPEMY